ncbi:methyl-accepting chemotaxis protein [Stutzerimonas kirkiae]|uniref:Chemotaxis protein n=1 Tax=Stutzerimonas kirkiae TaxID=2211392 RepID=A0A4Q9RC24_9GAMM|nr:PAS domain-containing methyl-accepting chemotaxis protein [Stutzerimonas kirkiae]TBU97815.1 chemotaxis protein [Stutzerimonas kirkiae]TBV04834.1 chemotaxis protein [Stutzerimonas kirkiae]TBV11970.1 chemotaxis protein [Stutzerimonas kirkiae]TBV15021.1 chemotaxis protein [Stutzerimonas kirkiae]
MKVNLPKSRQERPVPADKHLITTTDLHGNITYCNEAFVEISGFPRQELLGSAHNIVRHPEMPAVVFQQMWESLKAGRCWMGIVKNRCKGGEFYWVNAYVTPVTENGRIVGYESVRVRADAGQVSRAERVYARLSAQRAVAPVRERLLGLLPLAWGLPACLLVWLVHARVSVELGLLLALLGLLAMPLLSMRLQQRVLRRVRGDEAPASDVAVRTYTDLHGLPAQLQMLLIFERAKTRTALSRLGDYARQTTGLAAQSDRLSRESEASQQALRVEADMVATAMQQMTVSVTEVASHVQRTAEQARQVAQLSGDGSGDALQTRAVIERLKTRVLEISASVEALAEETQSIQQAANMIRAVAEQTNLLALNAAIEAARAGEQGRGFAVVADEVRALARKTQESTGAIERIIQSLRERAGQAVSVARSGSEESASGLVQVIATERALAGIDEAVEHIHDMTRQMASAAEQQAHVCEEIARQVSRIAGTCERNTLLCEQSSTIGGELSQTACSLHALVERFNG